LLLGVDGVSAVCSPSTTDDDKFWHDNRLPTVQVLLGSLIAVRNIYDGFALTLNSAVSGIQNVKISLSPSTVLIAIVIAVLVAATPFALAESIKNGEFFVLSRRFVDDMLARLHGPGRLRFILQPTVAILLGARNGTKDGREGVPPFLWVWPFTQQIVEN
jgi:hypothetical protein